jgi:hypothetical protein
MGFVFEFGCGAAPALPQSCGEEMAALAEPMQAVCCSPPATCAADGAPPTKCSADCAGIFCAGPFPQCPFPSVQIGAHGRFLR